MSTVAVSIRAPVVRWREAAIDGSLLGLFMASVGVFGGLLYSPASPAFTIFPSEPLRALAMGLAMGVTAAALIYSPWGGRSGAHMNPAVTLAFLRLGRITAPDAAAYVAAQLIGGLAGALLVGALVGPTFTEAPVSYAPTVPGHWGPAVAFGAELAMTFALLLTILYVSNTARLARFTGAVAGSFLVLYIAIATPISGMSINPARTLASAIPSGVYTGLWIYLSAPVLGMLLAAEVFARCRSLPGVHCCKLNHRRRILCPFCGCDGPIDFDAHKDDPG